MNSVVKVEGMHCKACKTLIEDVCLDLEGVQSCNADVETGKVTVEHNCNINIIKREIASLEEYKVS